MTENNVQYNQNNSTIDTQTHLALLGLYLCAGSLNLTSVSTVNTVYIMNMK
jgi:hypothetical protein